MINNDTICAISTPAGVGGVAMIRVSGKDAMSIVDSIWHGKRLTETLGYTARFGTIVDDIDSQPGEPLDQAVCVIYHAPHSFTGDNVVEISIHGSQYVQQRLLQLLIKHGCRLAGPGEFTRRAFAAGKLDLAQAEAVADVIASSTRAAHRLAVNQMRGSYSTKIASMRDSLLELCTLLELELDFSEEEVEFASRAKLLQLAEDTASSISTLCESFSRGNAIKNGVPVAIIGHTNAGKSTLLNALLGDERAIVSDVHGTTRDFIEDTVQIGDTLFRLTDTAGLRETADEIESIGIERAKARAARARIIIWLIDGSTSHETTTTESHTITTLLAENPGCTIVPVINKSDVASDENIKIHIKAIEDVINEATIVISAKNNHGLEALTEKLTQLSGSDAIEAGDILVTNARHYEALTHATNSINRVTEGLRNNLPGDLIAQDLRETIDHLSTITARVTSAEILQTIFNRFCIGK